MAKVKIALGYDTEAPYGARALTPDGQKFLQTHLDFVNKMSGVLDQERIPRTHFLLGQHLLATGLATDGDTLKYAYRRPLIEVGQHSFSHPVLVQPPGSVADPNIVSVDKYVNDIATAQTIISDLLGVQPAGLRTPVGYPCDLSELPRLDPHLELRIPALLSGLEQVGLSYVSSDLRGRVNSYKGEMTSRRQPHLYSGSKLIELPSHGYQDVVFSELSKAKAAFLNSLPNEEEIVSFYVELFDEAKQLSEETDRTIYVGLCLHPQAVMRYDPELQVHRRKIEEGRKRGMQFVSYGDIAKELKK